MSAFTPFRTMTALLLYICLTVMPGHAQNAWIFELPDPNSNPHSMVTPSGQRAWFLENNRLTMLDPSTALGKQMAFPNANSQTLAMQARMIKLPKQKQVSPVTHTVTPKVINLTLTVDNGFWQFAYGAQTDGQLIFTQNHFWFTGASTNTIVAFEPQALAASAGSTPQNNARVWTLPTANSWPVGLQADAQGHLWVIATQSKKLVRLDPAQNQFTEWTIPNTQGPGPSGPVIMTGGTVWFPDHGGRTLHRFMPQRNEFSAFQFAFDAGPSDLALDANQNIWMSVTDLGGLEGGLQAPALAQVGNNLTLYELPLSFVSPSVLGETPLGEIWCISESSHQIGRFNPQSRTFIYSTLPNIPSGLTQGLAIDPDGKVWFSNRGSNFVGYIANGAHYTRYLPFFIRDSGYDAHLSINNPNDQQTRVKVMAYEATGSLAEEVEDVIAAHAKWSQGIAAFLPNLKMGWLKVVADRPIDAVLLYREGQKYLDGWAATALPSNPLNFALGGLPDKASTWMLLNNPNRMDQLVSLNVYSNTGQVLATKAYALAAGAYRFVTTTDVLGSTPTAEGWFNFQPPFYGSVLGLQLFASGSQFAFIQAFGN